MELTLLGVFLSGRAWMLFSQWNMAKGFDIRPHVEMLYRISWAHPTIDLHAAFYGYHPPLAFLLPRIPLSLGLSPIASIQLVSAIASLASFLFFRQTLKAMGLLSDLRAIIALYVISSLPIQIFLSHSINMDAIVLACASAVLYFSARIATLNRRSHERLPLWALGITVSIVLAFMTKFTAILLLAIPVAAIIFLSAPKKILQNLCTSGLSVTLALVLVFPYYYTRYYVPAGTFFPSNTDTFDYGAQTNARNQRDDDPVAFIVSLFMQAKANAKGIEHRDLRTPRISDTWKDVFVQDAWMGKQSALQKSTEALYVNLASLLAPIGLALLLWKARTKRSSYEKLGLLLLGIGALHVLFILCYAYRNPWAGAVPMKAIYIAPATWMLGYLFVYPLTFASAWMSRHAKAILVPLTALFVLVNHVCVLY